MLGECQRIFAEELARASTSYAHYVAAGDMGQPQIVFLEREVFALYREMKMYTTGLSEAQLKPPRVLTTPELIAFFTSQAEQYPSVAEDRDSL
jgi:hypothetical protein